MFSYSPCGLSAERSYIKRKAHIISFYHLFDHEDIFYQFNKAYKIYKIYYLQKNMSKNISGIKHYMFQNRKEYDIKNGVICILSLFVI